MWAPLFPAVIAAISGHSMLIPARQLVIVWCVIVGSSEIIAMLLGARGVHNLWLAYIAEPVKAAALLWALALWQPDRSASLALKVAVPLVIAVSILLTLTLDDTRSFSLVVSPFHAIVTLLAAVWTFVSLSLDARSSIVREDWFWIVGGIMLYAATATAMQPLAWYLIKERVDLLHAAFNVRAGIVVLSFIAITWGMLPRGTPTSSGGSSSPPSSPSSFSSAA